MLRSLFSWVSGFFQGVDESASWHLSGNRGPDRFWKIYIGGAVDAILMILQRLYHN